MLLENLPASDLISQADLILTTNWNCEVKLETRDYGVGDGSRNTGGDIRLVGAFSLDNSHFSLNLIGRMMKISQLRVQTLNKVLTWTKLSFWCRLNFINQHKIGKNKIWIKV